MARNKLFLLCFLLVALPAVVCAEAVSSLEKANSAYQDGNFAAAITSYETAIREGANNGHVRYNLGNAYYRVGKFGRAIAEYRKALLEFPSDPDIRANLNLARDHAKDKIDTGDRQVATELLNALPKVSRALLRRIFLTLYGASWIAIILSSLFSLNGARALGVSGLLASLPMALVLYGTRVGRDGSLEFAFSQSDRSMHPAVIITSESKVFSGDGEGYQVIFVLHEGAEIMTGEKRGEWLEVQLPGERKGWLKSPDVDILKYEDT